MIKFNLKKVMKEKKITLKELSNNTGLSINTLSLLSTGKSKGIQFDTLEKIVQTLDCNVKDLIIVDDGFKTLQFVEIKKTEYGSFIFNKLEDNRIQYFKCVYKENDEEQKEILLSVLFSKEYVEVAISGDFPKEFLKSGKFFEKPTASGDIKEYVTLETVFLKEIIVSCYKTYEEFRNAFDFKNQQLVYNFEPYKSLMVTVKFNNEDDFLNRNAIPAYSILKDLVFLENNEIKVSNNFYKEEEIDEDDV
ncbi:helix-turn-helix domain-containing protein [Staphylococcus cohnii]|uniref:helix-turn-helix domain-containing protein n=1 Tax=Staphylococcus cohnii TaxID=29382 RepID=UPI003AC57AB6